MSAATAANGRPIGMLDDLPDAMIAGHTRYYRSQICLLARTNQFDILRFDDSASFGNVDHFGLVVAHRLRRVHVCPVPFVVVS